MFTMVFMLGCDKPVFKVEQIACGQALSSAIFAVLYVDTYD